MTGRGPQRVSPDEAAVLAKLRQPHLLSRLAENSLTVADSLRSNYFNNTTKFVADLRGSIRRDTKDEHKPVLHAMSADGMEWCDLRDEVVTFIDGGVGEVRLGGRVPLLLRVGSYRVKTGERQLRERENFAYYPVILGDLQGGTRSRKDFIDIVRITAELLGGLSAMERNPDLRVLMFHGPLLYHVGRYTTGGPAHTPWTESDLDRFLHQYASDAHRSQALKDEFLEEARVDIYPAMTDRADEWTRRRLFEPLSFMAFLYRRIFSLAKRRNPPVIVTGVVERGGTNEFSRILLEDVFRRLRKNHNTGYFNDIFGRTDLSNPSSLLEALGYTDGLLLAMLMDPGQMTMTWAMEKTHALRDGQIVLPGESYEAPVRFSPLRPESGFGFPQVNGCYVHVSDTTEPIRIETFADLEGNQAVEAACRAYRYARLLPGYGFPVGLDVVDKYAHVPRWMTDAYGKLIRLHLGTSLQSGEINDKQMRDILLQAIYMTHRDWLFRPGVT